MNHPDYERRPEGMLSDAAQMLREGKELMAEAKETLARGKALMDRLENGWLFKLLRKFGVV